MRGAAAACRDAALEAQEPKARAVAEYAGQVMAIAHTASHSRELARYTRRILAGDELADELTKQHRELPEELHAYVFGDWTPQEGPRWP